MRRDSGMLRAADTGAGTGGTSEPPPGEDGAGETPPAELTFDTWYGQLDPAARQVVDTHTAGLRTALSTERQQRGDLARQVRDLSSKAQKGSELEQQLTQLQSSLELAERKAAFAEDALRPEIGCVSLKAAWALAVQDDLFDRRGRPDWTALKVAAPELYQAFGNTLTEEQALIAAQVGERAAYTPSEFMAEVFVVILLRKPLPELARELYKQWGGVWP